MAEAPGKPPRDARPPSLRGSGLRGVEKGRFRAIALKDTGRADQVLRRFDEEPDHG